MIKRRFFPNNYLEKKEESDSKQLAQNKKAAMATKPGNNIYLDYFSELSKRKAIYDTNTTRFVVVALPDHTRIYEWFKISTEIGILYEFVRTHYKSPFVLVDEQVEENNLKESDYIAIDSDLQATYHFIKNNRIKSNVGMISSRLFLKAISTKEWEKFVKNYFLNKGKDYFFEEQKPFGNKPSQ